MLRREKSPRGNAEVYLVMLGFMPGIPIRAQCLSHRDRRDKPGDDGD